ncbi:MAG TPA: nicotinate (nicotinamide) nucleotide adenylyltransferase [Chroococcales cyanobacterium]|jgi:nicotinate-nucleotide adenylyltransferase
MRIGILGGSFDPIHLGHLALARLAQQQTGLDRVLFVPARLSPFKESDHASPIDRWAMTLLATEEESKWRTVRWELERPEPSYSIDTVLELERLLPGCEKFFIAGADILPTLQNWHHAEDLLARCTILVAPRSEWSREEISRGWGLSEANYRILEGQIVPLSSSGLRVRLQKKEDVSKDLHPSTLAYIERYGLYGLKESPWIPSTLS